MPPVTVTAAADAVEAARLMDTRDVKRLAVVDYDGRLQGIVSRRDLVKLLLRPDEEIAAEVRDDVLDRSLWVNTDGVQVDVRQGVVTLYGWMERRTEAAVAVRRPAGTRRQGRFGGDPFANRTVMDKPPSGRAPAVRVAW
ncbi:CBS domain-containing protein [Nonomuraea sp. NPDC049709]|uniref:CBS domain-containing protein n=1 Tax=Nonomuraea sp. NPDC049709 TaxID=3154736 RepID=UPI00341D8C5F